MLRLLLSLVSIGAVCGGLLIGTHAVTQGAIASNREARDRALMAELLGAPLPADWHIGEQIFGACAQHVFQHVAVNGYAGAIHITAMWRSADQSMALRVTGHRETPGIGDFIDHTRHPWLPDMDGSNQADFASLDNVTGATITTNAVRKAAQLAYENVAAYCGQ